MMCTYRDIHVPYSGNFQFSQIGNFNVSWVQFSQTHSIPLCAHTCTSMAIVDQVWKSMNFGTLKNFPTTQYRKLKYVCNALSQARGFLVVKLGFWWWNLAVAGYICSYYMYSGTPLNRHPSTADTYNITDISECPGRISIDFSTFKTPQQWTPRYSI